MKCSCCGRKRKPFESFEKIKENVDICVDCSQILYRIQDACKIEDKAEYKRNIDLIKGFKTDKKISIEFLKWLKDDFFKRNRINQKSM